MVEIEQMMWSPINGAGSALYMSEERSDISIFVECEAATWRFPAHSLFLCSMSRVISSMLENEMVEKATNEIIIKDSSPSAVRQFLRYIYTGEIHLPEWQEVTDLLSVAHKYQVGPLIKICEDRLLQALTLSRACILHEIGDLYSLRNLKSVAQELILHGAFAIGFTEGFENLSRTSLEFFLSSRLLNLESEVSLLKSLRNWSKAECVRRGMKITVDNVIGFMTPLLQHIRLNNISSERRKLIPPKLTKNRQAKNDLRRVRFFVSSLIHEHLASVKFVVELGSFLNKSLADSLVCAKFSSDKNIYIMGFRIVGLFRNGYMLENVRNRNARNRAAPMLTLCRQGNKDRPVSFDLGSIPWKSGANVGENIWREIVAYLPHPARIQQFSCYNLSINYNNMIPTKWPKTRLEFTKLTTELGDINIYTFGQCFGVTELFVLPAPPLIKSCNSLSD